MLLNGNLVDNFGEDLVVHALRIEYFGHVMLFKLMGNIRVLKDSVLLASVPVLQND